MKKVCCLMLSILFPTSVFANAGFPAIIIVWPPLVVTIIPIIVLESFAFSRLIETSFKSSIKNISIANIVSTVVGIPLTWIGLVIVEFSFLTIGGNFLAKLPDQIGILFTFPWLAPGIANNYANSKVPFFLLLGFFYIVSIYIEYRSIRQKYSEYDSGEIKRAIANANTFSYFFIFVGLALWQF